jgi:hypothetical protein
MKEFRDPAAHRMPLYCPPGVMLDDHQKEYKKATENLSKQKYSDENDDYMNALREQSNIGSFFPIFIGSSEIEIKIYPIDKTLFEDYSPFWELSIIVLDGINRILNTKNKD